MTTTPFALLNLLAGLSQREAAEYLCVRPDTVKSWCAGRNACPEGAHRDMRDLIAKQKRAAAEAIAQIKRLSLDHGSPDVIELAEPVDDDDAQAIGWPSVGAWRGMAARVVLGAPHVQFRIVPRGSTPATAAARISDVAPGRKPR